MVRLRRQRGRRRDVHRHDLRTLARTIDDFKPDWVIVPDPRDEHPDHHAAGVFVLDVPARLRADDSRWRNGQRVYTYLVHFHPARALAGRASPAGQDPADGPVPPPGAGRPPWVSLPLGSTETAAKRSALALYRLPGPCHARLPQSVHARRRELFTQTRRRRRRRGGAQLRGGPQPRGMTRSRSRCRHRGPSRRQGRPAAGGREAAEAHGPMIADNAGRARRSRRCNS